MKEIVYRNSSLYARHLIGRARHLMLLARQKELSPYQISPGQFNVLFILHKLGHEATLAELASYCYRGISNLSTQLTRMEKDGLIKKFREAPKSTLLKFKLTKKGFNCYRKNNKVTSAKVIMSVLSEEERQKLISILKKIINKAESSL
jgi:DNA-binding MarR family transcriptional regulator